MTKLPFFSVHLGDVVVEAVCVCGHLKRDHGSTLTKVAGALIRAPHDGNCCKSDCTCPRFTWERWVTAGELEVILAPQLEAMAG